MGYLISTDKLDFSLALRAWEKGSLGPPLGLALAQVLLCALRWKILLANGPFLKILSLTWLGLFFNSFLPGAVTGDLVKVYYAGKLRLQAGPKSLIFSALMDRVLGLVGLLALMGVSTLARYNDLVTRLPNLKGLLVVNLFFLAGSVAVLCALGLKIPLPYLPSPRPPLRALGAGLGLSLLSQVFNVSAFFLLSCPFFDAPLGFWDFFTFVPLGLLSVALPISPAGLGVGHVAFEALFALYGVGQGASLFNLFFLLTFLVNTLGVVPFLIFRPQN